MSEVRRLSATPDEHRVLRRAAPWLRGHRALLGLGTVVNLLAAIGQVAAFVLLGVVTDAVLAGDRTRVMVGAFGFLVLVLARFGLDRAAQLLVVRVGERVVRDLRDRAVEQVAAAPARFLEVHRSGDLLRRLTGEIADLSAFVGGTLPGLVNGALLLVVTLVTLCGYSAVLTGGLVLLGLLAALVLGRAYTRRAATAYAVLAEAEAVVAASFAESVTAREQLMLLGARRRRLAAFAEDNDALLRSRIGELRAERWLIGIGPAGGLSVVLLAGLAGVATAAGWISVGGAVVFLVAARSAFGDIEDLIGGLGELRAARTHLARVLDLVDATAPMPVFNNSRTVPDRGELLADGVGYRYDDGAPALVGVHLRARPGERIALVGPTGSGKTTLGKLLAGLYRPHHGAVTFAGVPLQEIPAPLLRRRIVAVPQEVVLVDGSIADNVLAVPDAPAAGRDAVLRVAGELGLGEWLATLPEGVDTRVGEHGRRLSAGERQLVALLRVGLVNAAVLILDEATADVDPVTAARVENAVARVATDRVVIVIAHRADTVARADRVIELAAGRVRHCIADRPPE